MSYGPPYLRTRAEGPCCSGARGEHAWNVAGRAGGATGVRAERVKAGGSSCTRRATSSVCMRGARDCARLDGTSTAGVRKHGAAAAAARPGSAHAPGGAQLRQRYGSGGTSLPRAGCGRRVSVPEEIGDQSSRRGMRAVTISRIARRRTNLAAR